MPRKADGAITGQKCETGKMPRKAAGKFTGQKREMAKYPRKATSEITGQNLITAKEPVIYTYALDDARKGSAVPRLSIFIVIYRIRGRW